MTHNVLSETLSLYTTTTTFQNTKLSHYVDIPVFWEVHLPATQSWGAQMFILHL